MAFFYWRNTPHISMAAIYNKADFRIDRNDKVGMIGVNGARKTTLFRVLLKDRSLTAVGWDAAMPASYALKDITYIGKMEQTTEPLIRFS